MAASHASGSGAPYYTKIDISALTELIETYKIRTYPDTCDAYGLIYDILKDDTTKKRRPFFIVDLGQVIKKFEQWCDCLPRVTPHYAVKCNPDPAIISVLGLMGCNFDCASQTEIAIVQDALKMHEETFADTTRILFANPIKDEEHIQYARANDVDMTVFDSSDELYKIKLYHTEANLLLRLNIDNPHSLINFGTKFGATMEEIPRLIDICRVLELNLIGVSFHVGTGCSDPLQYAQSLKLAKEVFSLAKSKGIHMNCVDIGGGFPGSDPLSEDEVSFEKIAEVINEAIDDLFGPNSEFPETQFIAEPGRFMVASSHTLVVNIIGKKIVTKTGTDGQPQKRFVYHLNDGVYGSFNCVLTEKTIPVFEPYNERAGIRFQSTLFGPTCDSLDQIPGVFMLPELVLGERLYIQNFGAYTSCLASDFNGFAKTPSFYIIKLPGERDEEESLPQPPPKRFGPPAAPAIKASL